MFKRLSVLMICLIPLLFVPVAQAIDEAPVPGRIAVIDTDYNVSTLSPDGTDLHSLTADATSEKRYQWPTWSTDNRLAYFCCDLREADSTDTRAFISPDGIEAGEAIFEGDGEPIIYAAWSPQNCASGTNCRDLAMLVNDIRNGTLSIELARNTTADTTLSTVGNGSPFYYHWSAAGNQMIFHRDSDDISIYDVSREEVIESYNALDSGLFQTPAWSPVDDRVLFAIRGRTPFSSNLVVAEDGHMRTIARNISGLMAFLWSPDGQYVAYRTITRDSISKLTVLDVENRGIIAESTLDSVLAFFWSPDSSKIAYITPATTAGFSVQAGINTDRVDTWPVQSDESPRFEWHVLNVESGQSTALAAFYPTYEMFYLMQYFDQFAPSHRVWSPDSRYLVYSDEINPGRPRPTITVADTQQPGAVENVLPGVFAVWSFQ
jgi:TolB protein